MWTSITEDDVERKLSELELTKVKTSSLAESQDDPMEGAITETTNEVRGYIQSGGTTLSADATLLPVSLHARTLHIVIFELLKRLPSAPSVEQTRIDDARDARRFFEEKIATGKIKVEDPDSGTASSPSPSFEGRTRKFTPETEDGV